MMSMLRSLVRSIRNKPNRLPLDGPNRLTLEELLAGPGLPEAFHTHLEEYLDPRQHSELDAQLPWFIKDQMHYPLSPGERVSPFLQARQALIARHGGAPKDIPALPIFSMSKSGSSLVTTTLTVGLHLAPICTSWVYKHVVPGWAKWMSQGGTVTHDHLWPNEHNLETLIENGLSKVFIHYRDPRAAAVSYAHHTSRFEDEAILARYVEYYVPWIMGWFELAEKYPNNITFGSYEELMQDIDGYFKRVLEWFEVDEKHHQQVYKKAKKFIRDKRSNNFRRGTIDGWKEELSTELIMQLWENTPEKLKERLSMTDGLK